MSVSRYQVEMKQGAQGAYSLVADSFDVDRCVRALCSSERSACLMSAGCYQNITCLRCDPDEGSEYCVSSCQVPQLNTNSAEVLSAYRDCEARKCLPGAAPLMQMLISRSGTGQPLLPKTAYYFRVRALNLVDDPALSNTTSTCVDYSSEVQVYTSEPGPSGPPDMLTLFRRRGGSLTITWSAPVDNGGESEYSVRLSRVTNVLQLEYGGAGSSFTVEGLVAQTEYTFSIKASTSRGLSGASLYFSFFTSPATPAAAPPAPLQVSVTGGAILLQFVAPRDTGGAPLTGILRERVDS